jgi:hypothetical protein
MGETYYTFGSFSAPGVSSSLASGVAVVLSTSYATVLKLSAQQIRGAGLEIVNNDNAIQVRYKLFATYNENADDTDLTTADWFNVLSPTPGQGGTYDATTEVLVPHNQKDNRGFGYPYAKICVQMKADSGTPNVTLYARGID